MGKKQIEKEDGPRGPNPKVISFLKDADKFSDDELDFICGSLKQARTERDRVSRMKNHDKPLKKDKQFKG